MQVVENWAEVKGTVQGLGPHPSLDGYSVVEVQVESVADVTGYPNLFHSAAGQTLAVNVPKDRVGELLAPGEQVTLHVRRGGPGSVFAHPDRITVP